MPCSNAYPAKLNRLTGELISFSLPSSGREPGGWFAALDLEDARALRRGKLTFDDLVNRQEHEDGPRKAGGGESGISRTIRVGDAPLDFDAPPIEVDGKVHSMAFASNCLFVTTQEGAIYCFTAKDKTQEAQPKLEGRTKTISGKSLGQRGGRKHQDIKQQPIRNRNRGWLSRWFSLGSFGGRYRISNHRLG